MRDHISHSETPLPRWDGALYAANAGHHRAFDEWFLDSLPLTSVDRVLDVGCGAGDFTAAVARRVPEGHVVGLEPSQSQLTLARANALPNQSFVEGSVQDLELLLPEERVFDVVISRSVLHWVPIADHASALTSFHRVLRPSGWLRLEFGGAGNIPQILPVTDDESSVLGGPTCPWSFPDAATYLDLINRAGFDATEGYVRTIAQRRAFDSESLLGWLRSQCFQAYEHGMAAEVHTAFRARVESRLDEMRRHDGSYDQTFVRLDALARRP